MLFILFCHSVYCKYYTHNCRRWRREKLSAVFFLTASPGINTRPLSEKMSGEGEGRGGGGNPPVEKPDPAPTVPHSPCAPTKAGSTLRLCRRYFVTISSSHSFRISYNFSCFLVFFFSYSVLHPLRMPLSGLRDLNANFTIWNCEEILKADYYLILEGLYTVKKRLTHFYSRPRRVWLVASRRGTGNR